MPILAVGQICFANVTELMANEELTRKDHDFGLPVLYHLHMDTRTLPQSKRAILDSADSSPVDNTTICGRSMHVSRLMTALVDK